MTIVEKIECCADRTKFTLFKEGLFYKCYNADAMVFSKRVKNYSVTARFVKSASDYVLSLGFPGTEVENGKLSFPAIQTALSSSSFGETEGGVQFVISSDLKQGYHDYRNGIIELKNAMAADQSCSESEVDLHIIKLIQEFDLANSSPMQAMLFIQELKNAVTNRT